jgi:hypothetical protein
LKKDCPDLTEARRKELQDLYTMKVERKGQGTGRKKNKRPASEDAGGEGEGPSKKPFLNEFRPKKVLKDKTGTLKIMKNLLFSLSYYESE